MDHAVEVLVVPLIQVYPLAEGVKPKSATVRFVFRKEDFWEPSRRSEPSTFTVHWWAPAHPESTMSPGLA